MPLCRNLVTINTAFLSGPLQDLCSPHLASDGPVAHELFKSIILRRGQSLEIGTYILDRHALALHKRLLDMYEALRPRPPPPQVTDLIPAPSPPPPQVWKWASCDEFRSWREALVHEVQEVRDDIHEVRYWPC